MRELLAADVLPELDDIIQSRKNELEAIKKITIAAWHKKLTNKTIEHAQIANKDWGYKELRYQFDRIEQGRRIFEHGHISVSEKTDETKDGVYVPRLISPMELFDKLAAQIKGVQGQLDQAEKEKSEINQIVARSNELQKQVDDFNGSFFYARAAKIKGGY